MFIKDIMTKTVVCAAPDENIISISRKMRDDKIGAIPVCNSGKVVGVVTDRDIVTRAVAKGSDFTKFTAGQIMTKTPVTARETETVEDAVHLMENKHIRRLPVLDKKDRLTGILTLDDIGTHTPHELSGEALEALSFSKRTRPTTTEARV